MKYRAEVDGLRAIAVSPVIAYHANSAFCPGGFVGVDVFFVISGYLITSLIFAEIESQRFSLAHFYERRARRLLPALLCMLLSTIVVSWFALLPGDMVDFAESLIATSFFSSNVVLWRQSGYFDTAAELKPLLHTWSLAVEEQYYLVFPGLMLLVAKLFPRARTAILVLGFIISFILCVSVAHFKPAAAYFLLPTRAWELLLGALVVCCSPVRLRSAHMDGPLAAIGLAAIVGSVALIDASKVYPGFVALVPTIGTALVLIYAREGTAVHRILSLRALTAVGLLSYSAYLWHQPIFVFARYLRGREIGSGVYLSLAALTFSISYLSWRYVERPWRDQSRVGRSNLVVSLVLGFSLVSLCGVVLRASEGFPARFKGADSPILALASITDPYEYFQYKQIVRYGVCHSVLLDSFRSNHCLDLRQRNVFVVGDSYAATLVSALTKMRDDRFPSVGVTQLTDGNGPPFLRGGRTDSGQDLRDVSAQRLELIRRYQPEVVLFHWMIDGSNAPRSEADSLSSLALIATQIREVSPKTMLVIVGPLPKWSISLQRQMVNFWLLNKELPPRRLRTGLGAKEFEWDRDFEVRMAGPNIRYLSAIRALCNEDGCLARLSEDLTDLTTVDWGHLTGRGSEYLMAKIGSQVFYEATRPE